MVINSDLCADCHGPCVDFCDRYAIRYASDAEEFAVLKARTLGTLSETEAAEALHRLKQQAEAAAKAQSVIAEATTVTFDDIVLRNSQPVVVDFWAPWCGPCKALAPIIERLAKQCEGLVQFVEVNTEAEPPLATRFGIRSIPTLGFFWCGQLIDALVGALPEAQLQTAIYQFLALVRQVNAQEEPTSGSRDAE